MRLSAKFTRRRLLQSAGAGALWIALSNLAGCTSKHPPSGHSPSGHSPSAGSGPAWRSQPNLSPAPTVEVTTPAHDTAQGYIFVAPRGGEAGPGGPMILDDRGQAVWFSPVRGEDEFAMNFKVQNYLGRPVLTWDHHVVGGKEEYLILDFSYRKVATVHAGNGHRGNFHEFLISPQGTALITVYYKAHGDLTPFGGPKNGVVYAGIAQEVDIESGEVLFEWQSLDHVGLGESYAKLGQISRPGLDYFHINSIDVDHDGNLLVSARNTWTVYKIDRKSGEIIWRLGGKNSDFEMGPGAHFAFQHDARRQPDGTISIFDNGKVIENGKSGKPKAVEGSRGIILRTDEAKMTATLVREYIHPHQQYSAVGGSMQVLPNGNVFIGWDPAEEDYSEFSKDGDLLFSARFSPRDKSYRAFRFPWSGRPKGQPAVAAERVSQGQVRVYVSWNGNTEVATWEVLAGPNPDRLKTVGSASKDNFETTITVHTAEPYVSVRARDSSNRVLGSTKVIKLGDQAVVDKPPAVLPREHPAVEGGTQASAPLGHEGGYE